LLTRIATTINASLRANEKLTAFFWNLEAAIRTCGELV